MLSSPSHRGLFVGLTTLDLVYQVPQLPHPNQKQVATDYTVAAGGPATNAAVAFQHFGNQTTVLSAIGCHPMSHLIRRDLEVCGVTIADLAPDRAELPPVSSIIVTASSGDRAVVSLNATQMSIPLDRIPADCLAGVDIVLIDGHQMAIGATIAQHAKAQGIPVVIDGGSWKPGFETILPWVDYAICSANFHPPGYETEAEVLAFLRQFAIPHIAITHGERPIVYQTLADQGKLAPPRIHPIDTLGAGDIFHGAFCHFILQRPFTDALLQASQVAAHACQSFGTRRWLEEVSVLG